MIAQSVATVLTKAWMSFRVWTGRRFSREKSRRRSSRPSEAKKTSATSTWSSPLSFLLSRRPESAAPSPARNRTTSSTLTMSPTSARVREVTGFLSCPLPATDSEMRLEKWRLTLCPEKQGGDERRGSLLTPSSLCCVVLTFAMGLKTGLGRACVDGDQCVTDVPTSRGHHVRDTAWLLKEEEEEVVVIK